MKQQVLYKTCDHYATGNPKLFFAAFNSFPIMPFYLLKHFVTIKDINDKDITSGIKQNLILQE